MDSVSYSSNCLSTLQCDQGIKNLMADDAARLATDDPDYAIRDLYNHISEGDFPSWTLKIQVMTFEEAEKFRYNPFDLTKVQLYKRVMSTGDVCKWDLARDLVHCMYMCCVVDLTVGLICCIYMCFVVDLAPGRVPPDPSGKNGP